MKSTFYGPKKLKIKFTSTSYGLLYFTLSLGGELFETRFSEAFDPTINFRKWLEAVSVGVNQCSFWFETEGAEIKFNLERHSLEREIFIVSDTYGEKIFLSDYVERKQLVEEFYLGFLAFTESPQFDKAAWEAQHLWEHITNNLGVDYRTLLLRLCELNRNQLKGTLSELDPWDKPDPIEGDSGEFGLDVPLGDWIIPLEYDRWNLEEKQKFVEKCLSYRSNEFNAAKISEFRSSIVDQYLGH